MGGTVAVYLFWFGSCSTCSFFKRTWDVRGFDSQTGRNTRGGVQRGRGCSRCQESVEDDGAPLDDGDGDVKPDTTCLGLVYSPINMN